MAPAQKYEIDPKKPGFLGLGFQVGESLPWSVFPSSVEHKIGEKGEILFHTRSAGEVWREIRDHFDSYHRSKAEDIVLQIIRGWSAFKRALSGYPIRTTVAGWPVPPLPVWDSPLQIPKEWEMAPIQVQEMALESAKKFISSQMEQSDNA